MYKKFVPKTRLYLFWIALSVLPKDPGSRSLVPKGHPGWSSSSSEGSRGACTLGARGFQVFKGLEIITQETLAGKLSEGSGTQGRVHALSIDKPTDNYYCYYANTH